MHVDGFRFDLAAILGRGANGKVLDDPPLIQHIAEHPVLAGTKLIAEAWDAAGLSRMGKFPAWGRWAELNGVFRDDVRRFIRGDAGATANVAKRICGSLDLYGDTDSRPVSLGQLRHLPRRLHAQRSGQLQRQAQRGQRREQPRRLGRQSLLQLRPRGADGQRLHQAVRQRQMRNYFTMLLISQGVPFLSHGDEFARTQRGNNNAYCQDNDISWVDWSLTQKNAGLVRFVRLMIALRKKHFALSREQFVNRVSWHGRNVGEPDWTGMSRVLAFHLHGGHGQPDLYVMFNAHWESQRFNLPVARRSRHWKRLVDTNLSSPDDIVEEPNAVSLHPADHYIMSPRSAVILMASR